MDNSEKITCRPGKANLGLAAFIGAVGLLPLALLFVPPGGAGIWVPVGLLFTICFVPAFLLAIWICRAQVIADSKGLRWRGLGGWREASWPEVTDYYETLPQTQKQSVSYGVVTPVGKLSLRGDLWPDNTALRVAISQRAVSAKAKDWGVLGLRSALDWPREFRYNSPDNRVMAVCVCLGALTLGWLAVHAAAHIGRTFSQMGPRWGSAEIGMFALGLLPMAVILGLAGLAVFNTHKRRKEKIIVSVEGIACENNVMITQAHWEEIRDYHLATGKGMMIKPRGVVRTANGSFDFTMDLRDAHLLRKIIADQATEATPKEWKPDVDTESLGGVGARWSSGCEGVGERVFRYRTRTIRALIWFLMIPALPPLLLTPLWLTGQAPKPNWILEGIWFALSAWCWWRYGAAAIEIDGVGISQLTISGRRHIRWQDVERYFISGSDTMKFGNVCGQGQRIRFWIGIADLEELKAEIARRAVNSQNPSWDEVPVKVVRRVNRVK